MAAVLADCGELERIFNAVQRELVALTGKGEAERRRQQSTKSDLHRDGIEPLGTVLTIDG